MNTKFGIGVVVGLFWATSLVNAQDTPSVLGAGSRELNAAVELNGKIAAGEQTYLIYYANETDPESVNRLANWLSTSDKPEHQEASTRLREDAKKFPMVVANELKALMKGAAADSMLGLIVFTNSLADRGVFQLMDCDDTEPKLVKWPVFQSRLKVFQSHPLAHPRSLDLALQAVGKTLTKAEIDRSDFVLIAKSHGSQKLAIAQGYAPLHEPKSAQQLLAALADLKSAAEKSIEIDQVIKSRHQIAFDRTLGAESVARIGWGDNLGGSSTNTLGAGGSVSDSNLDPSADDTLGAGGDSASSTLGASGRVSDKTMTAASDTTLDPSADDTLGAGGDSASTTLGASGDSANSTLGTSGRVSDKTMDVAADTTLDPSADNTLGTSGRVSDKTMTAASDTTLDPSADDTLGAGGDSASTTLGASGDSANSTLGAGNGVSAAKFLVSGTRKDQFLDAVLSTQKLGIRFHTVFIESCQSELSQSALEQTRQQENGNIGRLFTSTLSGLRYRTIDYGQLFASRQQPCCGDEAPRFATLFVNTMNQIAKVHLREGLPADEDTHREFAVIAHRGASGYLPEHTLEAYSLAYGMGVDFIEQDVVLTKDHQPIVLHDIHLDTVTNVAELFPDRKREDGRYYAIDLTLKEIRTLSVHERVNHETGQAVFASRFPHGKSSFRIPTLMEAIELVQGLNRASGKSVGIYPEIKKPRWHRDQGVDISRIVLKTLKDAGYQTKEDAIYLQCFDPVETRRIREELECPLRLVQLIGSNDWNEANIDYSTLITSEGLKAIAQYADGIGPWMPYIVKGRDPDGHLELTKLVKMAHGNDLIVHPFTFRADSLPDYATDLGELVRIFRNAGVDGIFTDQPDQARRSVSVPNASAPTALINASRCDPKDDPTCGN